ncbi:antitoxin YezG family protein [Anoxybacteroides tepidamans]|uniref:antitoxin YezG family protein n=1 Tax=Anoxybacteroides tepidamans TaxID=265948 RepID=UPI00047F9FD1|nr:antitoxin YezG family protein [Anoxybacillus tepidamans]
MNEEKLGILYHEIAEVIVDTIPEEWSKVYLYGEIIEGSQTTYFYYYPEGGDRPIYSHDVPKLFTISECKYSEKWHQLVDLIMKLWTEFKDNDQEAWTNFTLTLESTGKFKIDFNYDDLSDADPHERKTIWKYKYLGIIPKSNLGKKHLEKYLETVKREGK